MSIADWLEQVHHQPHEHRRRLMWVSVACALLVVGFFWVLAMKHELKVVFDRARTQSGVERSFKEAVADQAPSLGDTLKASVQDFLSIFKAAPPDQAAPPPAVTPAPARPGEPDKAQPAPAAPPQQKFLPD